jgi:hypothetical protein
MSKCVKCNKLYNNICLNCKISKLKGGATKYLVLSDPEGYSIEKMVNSNTYDDDKRNITLIITGDICDSTSLGSNGNYDKFVRHKSFNIRNLEYICKTNAYKVILGNRDLTKLKCKRLFNMSSDCKNINQEDIEKFNNGVIYTQDAFNEKYKGEHKFNSSNCLGQYLSYDQETNLKIKFGNQKVLEEILKKETHSFLEIYDIAFHSSGVGDNFLYTIPYEFYTHYMKTTPPTKAEIDSNKEYYAYLVLCLFNYMFLEPNLEDRDDIQYKLIKGLLYKFFYRENTHMLYFLDDKFLFSHGGITKYCIYYYINYYYILLNKINTQFIDGSINISESGEKLVEPYSKQDINKFVKNCNHIFKLLINYILEDLVNKCDDKKNEIYYKYLIMSATEMDIAYINEWEKFVQWEHLNSNNSDKKISNNYLSTIGPGIYNSSGLPGFSQNPKINFYAQDEICQIIGHKPLGVFPSYYPFGLYKQSIYTTDISNSFFGDISINQDYHNSEETEDVNYNMIKITKFEAIEAINSHQIEYNTKIVLHEEGFIHNYYSSIKEDLYEFIKKILMGKSANKYIYRSESLKKLDKKFSFYKFSSNTELTNTYYVSDDILFLQNGIYLVGIDSRTRYTIYSFIKGYKVIILILDMDDYIDFKNRFSKSIIKSKYLKYKYKYLKLNN